MTDEQLQTLDQLYPDDEYKEQREAVEPIALELLKINDMQAETVFAEIKEKLRIVMPAETDALEEKLDNFDFKGALDMLATMTEYLNILLEKEATDER